MAHETLKQRWYVVGAPWLPTNMQPYIVAGNPDPYVGMAIIDFMESDEWAEIYDTEPPDRGEFAQHIVDLHNASLEAGDDDG